MTPTLPTLYIAALGCIGLLLLLARHNKRTGWVKERNTFIQDLQALSAMWEEAATEHGGERTAQAATSPVANIGKVSHAEASAFSWDLVRLQTALCQETSVAAPEAHVAA